MFKKNHAKFLGPLIVATLVSGCATQERYPSSADELTLSQIIEQIKNACFDIFKDYDVEYCYLFGSYAKGNANPKSDIDLLISVNASGLQFFEIVERLREKLKKKIRGYLEEVIHSQKRIMILNKRIF